MKKQQRTYVVEATSTHRYGLNQDYYFRTEGEAQQYLAELKEWFKNCLGRQFKITSHAL